MSIENLIVVIKNIEVYVCDVSISMATDVDQDGLISREDMYEMLDAMTDQPLKDSVKRKVVEEVSRDKENRR